MRPIVLGATLLAACALGLGVGESVVRLRSLGPSSELLGPWRARVPWERIRALDEEGSPQPRPDGTARWKLHPWSEPVDYRLDGDGFRVASPERAEPAPGACRVLVTGDSNAFGYGVPAAAAYPARLERRLARAAIPARVANAGICDSNVRDLRAWTADVVPRFGPDVVVLTLSPWSLRVDGASPPRDGTVPERLWNVLDARLRDAAAVSGLADRGARRVAHALNAAVGWPPPQAVTDELLPLLEPPERFARRFTAAAREVAAIARTAQEASAELVLVFVPLDVQLSRSRNALYLQERLPYPSYGFRDADYTAERRYRGLARLAAALDAPLVDARAALAPAAGAAYLDDDYHLGPEGHRRLAAAVAPAVARACARARLGADGGELFVAAREDG